VLKKGINGIIKSAVALLGRNQIYGVYL